MPLTVEEVAALDSMPLADRKSSSVIFDLQGWNDTVTALNGPFNWSSDEYFNDIASRTSLQVRLEQLEGPLALRLKQLLAPLDASFIEKTEPMDSIWVLMPEAYFWCHRIPKVVAKAYEEDFNGFRVRERK